MRQNFKDKQYFENFIKDIESESQYIVDEELEFISNKVDYNIEAVNMQLYSNQWLLINALYTKGESINNIIKLYDNLITCYIKSISNNENYSDGGDLIYNELLSIICFGRLILSKRINDILNILKKINYKDDIIFYFLTDTINFFNNVYLWSNNKYTNLFDKILKSTKSEAEKLLKNYLENDFFSKGNLEDQYNIHKKKNQYSFAGYWSWEAAAIVKVMGLDDRGFKDNPYYPYDMVHWQD